MASQARAGHHARVEADNVHLKVLARLSADERGDQEVARHVAGHPGDAGRRHLLGARAGWSTPCDDHGPGLRTRVEAAFEVPGRPDVEHPAPLSSLRGSPDRCSGMLYGWEDEPVLTDTATTQAVLDVVGVFVFALSGAVVAVRRGLDLFGILVLAWVAGLGGGIIRDLFLGITPPVAVSDWQLLAAACAAAVLVFALHGRWEEMAQREPDVRSRRVPYAVRLLDAGGLAFFAVNGALVALSLDAGALAATLIGGITAVGGGVLRDVLAGRVPEVLQRELPYALPALFGAALVVLADHYGVTSRWTIWGTVALVFAIRVLAVALDLNAPRALRSGT